MKKLLCLVCYLVILLVSPVKAKAAIFVSELYPAPHPNEKEWIELANISDQDVSLDNWQLWDSISTPSKILTIPEGTKLSARSFIVFELPTAKLNNAGDGVTIRSADGTNIDQVVYQDAESDSSFTRKSVADTEMILDTPTPGSDSAAWPLVSTTSSTPTPSPSPSPYSGNTTTSLTAFLACPTSGDEWIELYSTADAIEVNNWIIKDAAGNSRKISGHLAPHTLTQFSWSGAMLGNAGDSFTIFTDTGELVDSASFDACIPGLAHVFAEQDWIQLQDHTSPVTTAPTTPTPSPTSSPTPAASLPASPSSTLSRNAPQVLSAQHTNFALPQHTLESLRTNAQVRSLKLELNPSQRPISSLISAIIGGLLLVLAGSAILYDRYRKNNHAETL